MKHIVLFATLLLLIIGCSNPSANDTQPNPSNNEEIAVEDANTAVKQTEESHEEINTIPAIISRVVDGDTLRVILHNNTEETVRLLLIDTPETVHPNKPVQPFGPEASEFVKKLLPEGKEVELELGISERDKYGRLLAYVYVDGKMINKMLLEQGLARVAYVFAPNTKYVDEFRNIQEKARQNGIGIWSIENYALEEGYNEEAAETPQIENKNNDCDIKGNINAKGEKIYHTPSSPWYDKTAPEVMFCSEEEAIAAGFRAPKR